MDASTVAINERLRTALGEFLEFDLDDDGDLYADYPGTRAYFAPVSLADEHMAVHVYCVVDQALPPAPALFRWIAVKSRLYRFGTLGAVVREDARVDVIFSHHVIIDHLTDEDVRATVLPVVSTAGELHGEAHSLFAEAQ